MHIWRPARLLAVCLLACAEAQADESRVSMHSLTVDWGRFSQLVYPAGAVLLACLGIFVVIWNRSLRREVQRTMAVKKMLREELAFRKAMLDGMPHAVAVRDRELKLTLCNEAYRRAFNAPGDGLPGSTPSESPFFGGSKEAAAAMEQRYRAIFEDGEPVSEDIDLEVDGQMRKIFHWAAPVSLGDGGPPVALVTGGLDVTERYHLLDLVQRARAKAETADRAKSNFLATMSHEIRSPMNAVMGMLELLLRKGRLDTQDKESIEIAHASARSLLDLIDDILDISKIEAGGLEIVPRPTQLRHIVCDAARVFESLAHQQGLAIQVEIDPSISPWHEIDALRFRQIINNLVSNAIKYTDTGGVCLRLLYGGRTGDIEAVTLEVEDTGIGIASKDVPYLFQPFFQAESAGPRTIGGTGLGLPIVQRLCVKMNGDISVESEVGRGTCVRVAFSLPVLATPEPGAMPDAEDREPSERLEQRGRYSILVVDDHAANRLLLQRQLEHLGFRCTTADNGESALRMWRDEVFDLVITDCSMPIMDGYALTAAIRAQERRQKLPHCPVIGCTAHAQEEERRHALAVGMDECLIKPVGIDELLRALIRHLHSEEEVPAPAPSEPAAGGLMDIESMEIFSDDDGSAEADFLNALLRANRTDLLDLQVLFRSGALREAAARAHKIKGAAAVVKATEVVRACEAIEAAFRAEDKAGMGASIDVLTERLERLDEAIATRLQASAVPGG